MIADFNHFIRLFSYGGLAEWLIALGLNPREGSCDLPRVRISHPPPKFAEKWPSGLRHMLGKHTWFIATESSNLSFSAIDKYWHEN